MEKVVVGISGNIKELPARSGLPYDVVSRRLSDGVKEAGGLPIIIPVGSPDLAKDYISMIDKLVLSGGQNVTPKFYGESKIIDSDNYSLERDEFELALINEALKQNKPIFAVCRGMQLLNVALGGTLNQKVEHHWQEEFSGTSQKVEILPDSRVSKLLSTGSWVNSFHQQSVKELAPSLVATARDPRDGTIEAYESKDGAPILGFQWHPELLLEKAESRRIFSYLVQQL
ncbi:gamma-glutamyl-gamma-aminobutyrate hydrolase family protein [Streptococcus ruminicola]|uniref:gamma-glutamyl-gamma-aminobutyrate hydrolase family protein n=1 Tax=Streptococcus ruminicola TaxID=2686210 RepID=UPI002413F9DE|nr:gamma-glutamyl-gamma-aminobutyrate hydrolase family protein [Streptococcus ruminicola]WFM82010.1 gamma-glutamyl-gamma-aminobutyrate hydrolase family protein [Streptococcus ruminicola]